jgi:hypothetical protein
LISQSRGLGDVYKRQRSDTSIPIKRMPILGGVIVPELVEKTLVGVSITTWQAKH